MRVRQLGSQAAVLRDVLGEGTADAQAGQAGIRAPRTGGHGDRELLDLRQGSATYYTDTKQTLTMS